MAAVRGLDAMNDDDVDYVPDQYDDSEQYPWDCDQGVPW